MQSIKPIKHHLKAVKNQPSTQKEQIIWLLSWFHYAPFLSLIFRNNKTIKGTANKLGLNLIHLNSGILMLLLWELIFVFYLRKHNHVVKTNVDFRHSLQRGKSWLYVINLCIIVCFLIDKCWEPNIGFKIFFNIKLQIEKVTHMKI